MPLLRYQIHHRSVGFHSNNSLLPAIICSGPRTNKSNATNNVDASENTDTACEYFLSVKAQSMDIVLAASNGKSLGDPTAVDDDGFLADIDISSITGAKKPKGDVNKDIRHFFGSVYHLSLIHI